MFKSARDYHDYTSYDRFHMKGHHMDWPNQPSVFKEYSGVELIPLRKAEEFTQVSLAGLCLGKKPEEAGSSLDFTTLSSVLNLAHAITAKAKYGGSYFYYRSVASAGALYPFETYVCAIDVNGLEPGLYHHNIARDGLERIHQGAVASKPLDVPYVDHPKTSHAVFFITSIFFRSSWKYRDRAYRYHLLDSGHLLENLVLALKYYNLDYRILMDFDDTGMNAFLKVDDRREVCLASIVVGSSAQNIFRAYDEPGKTYDDLSGFSKVSDGEIQYPAIHEIHSLTKQSVSRPDFVGVNPVNLGLNLKVCADVGSIQTDIESRDYPQAVFARRSSRNFVKRDVSSDQLAYLLGVLDDRKKHADTLPCADGVVIGLLASRIQGLSEGFYVYNGRADGLCLCHEGNLIDDMTHICLDQAWLANCAAHFLFMVNLDYLEMRFGPRGYRRALLHAGSLGQRLYVACAALQLGCCGIGAFYDSEARALLELNEESRLIYLLGVGPLKKKSIENP